MKNRNAIALTGLVLLGLATFPVWGQVIPQPGPPTPIGCSFNTVPPTLTSGQAGWVQCAANGALLTSGGSGGTASQVQGNSASGATDTGNPVKIGGVFNAALPTLTNGQRGDAQMDAGGNLNVRLMAVPATGADGLVNTLGFVSANTNLTSRPLAMMPFHWNGTGYDRQRGGLQGTWHNITATSDSGAASTPVVTPAAANNVVLKASAGNLYSVDAANHTATAGFLVIINAASAPADGAIAPLACQALPANGNASLSFRTPTRYSTGITAVLTSGANCFTKATGVITGFIAGVAQ